MLRKNMIFEKMIGKLADAMELAYVLCDVFHNKKVRRTIDASELVADMYCVSVGLLLMGWLVDDDMERKMTKREKDAELHRFQLDLRKRDIDLDRLLLIKDVLESMSSRYSGWERKIKGETEEQWEQLQKKLLESKVGWKEFDQRSLDIMANHSVCKSMGKFANQLTAFRSLLLAYLAVQRRKEVEKDSFAAWGLNRWIKDPTATVTFADLQKDYREWAGYQGIKPISAKIFTQRVQDGGFRIDKKSVRPRRYKGVRLVRD